MKKFSCILILLIILSDLTASNSDFSKPHTMYNIDLSDLSKVQVYTASRELTPLKLAPSVVSVITAEEIKNRGYSSLSEVLQRTAGFFIAPDVSQTLIGNRGFSQNPNNNYLMLIDGHPVNSVMDEGVGNMHMLPFLYQVKRIEIIRGPGSTLWGADALNGIIHIFTYDGDELAKMSENGTQINALYDFQKQRNVLNVLSGINLGENASLMLSATRTESHNEYREAYKAKDQGLVLRKNYYKYNSWRPSSEIQAKLKYYDFYLDARSVRFASYYRQYTTDINDDTRDQNFDYIRVGYKGSLGNNFRLDTNIYYNYSQTIDKAQKPKERWDYMSYDEKGLNAVLSYDGLENHRVKVGLQYKYRDFKPRVTQSGISTMQGIEQLKGVFFENTYTGIDDWYFTFGLRYQENDFRQASEDFLPRFAAIWSYSPELTFKYLYNTGVMPASLTRSRSNIENPVVYQPDFINYPIMVQGAQKPQYSQSHDLQLMYERNDIRANLTLFYTKIDGYIARVDPQYNTGKTLADGTEIWIMDNNLADLTAYGFEMELEYKINTKLLIYSNYAYAINEANEVSGTMAGSNATYDLSTSTYFDTTGRMTGAPKHIWNLGFDYIPIKDILLNLHYRGWSDALGKIDTSPNTFTSYGPEHFVDINVRYQDCVLKGLELRAFVKNLLNNKYETPQAPHGGYISMPGYHMGINMSYRF